ncbi:uncharacterized protein LOC126613842 [Malus sylvestris]|uniref:uncharacterized protein LOC126583820 n=1 Tax=Malus sylvestris TaxID=3752 RepID=UPI0021ACCF85|nr:uncharacterized protein LOC126583820 [Malus sylvestris]XP_050137405.1 uncharacterized protein LOC126613842 [Malus sylvestris]
MLTIALKLQPSPKFTYNIHPNSPTTIHPNSPTTFTQIHLQPSPKFTYNIHPNSPTTIHPNSPTTSTQIHLPKFTYNIHPNSPTTIHPNSPTTSTQIHLQQSIQIHLQPPPKFTYNNPPIHLQHPPKQMDGGGSFPKPINRLLHQRIKGGFFYIHFLYSQIGREVTPHQSLEASKLRSSQANPEGSRKPYLFFVKSSFKIKPQRPLKNFHPFKIKPRRPLKKVFIVHHLFVQDQASTAPGSTTLHLHVSKIESEAKFVEEIVTPKSLIQILFCARCSCLIHCRNSVFTNLARPVGLVSTSHLYL